MDTTCNFCGCQLDSHAPTTHTLESGNQIWCQACEDRMQAEVEALTPAQIADMLEGIPSHETRHFVRAVELLRDMNDAREAALGIYADYAVAREEELKWGNEESQVISVARHDVALEMLKVIYPQFRPQPAPAKAEAGEGDQGPEGVG